MDATRTLFRLVRMMAVCTRTERWRASASPPHERVCKSLRSSCPCSSKLHTKADVSVALVGARPRLRRAERARQSRKRDRTPALRVAVQSTRDLLRALRCERRPAPGPSRAELRLTAAE